MITSTPFGALKQVDAGLLSVGYAEAGPADGTAVMLLHGWPYDIHSFAEVTPLLAAAGYRVIVPFVRGNGTTRFLADATLRNGQPAAVAADVIAHMDALGIGQAILAGFDWGAPVGQHRRRAMAGPVQGPGLGQRVPDWQPGRQRRAPAAGRRVHLVVYVLLRHRARPGRLPHIPARVQQAHLAAGLTAVGFRRRHVRAPRPRSTTPTTSRS
jgi:pimeloyl-ACP methyl ester carboxylesterase